MVPSIARSPRPGRSLARVSSRLAAVAASLAALVGCPRSPPRQSDFPASAEQEVPGTVLMVLSAASVQVLADGSTRETGYFLNEFYEPYRALVEGGYQIAIATADGKPPALDPESLDPKYWRARPEALGQARALVASLEPLARPLSLQEARARSDQFQGIVVPGGQGVMVDLLDDPSLHDLILTFAASDRPIGLICHAPAILTRLPLDRNPLRGRRVTSVSGFEEWYIETFVMDARAQVREIGDRLDDAGYLHENAFPGRSRAVRDCNLVTSQNPFSGDAFSAHLLAALADWRRGGRGCAAP